MKLGFQAWTIPIIFGAVVTSTPVLAQPAPPPTADDDELEVPAVPETGVATPAPRGTVLSPAPTETPAASPAPAPAASPPASTAARDQKRAPAAAQGLAPSAPGTAAFASTNLEKVAYGRPVPRELTLSGYIQAQYEHNDISEDQLQQGETPLNLDRFVVRRARLRLDRGWDYAAATLELDANTVRGPSVGIRRAEASLLYRGSKPDDAAPFAQLSVGVTDLPFGFELAESSRVRPFMERSLASSALFPSEADVGAKLSGAVAFVRYGLMISNGEPLDDHGFPNDPNAAKDLTGRLGVDLDLGESVQVAGGTSFAVGKGFHAGSAATKDGVAWRDNDEDRVADADQNEIVGVPGSAETKSESFERWVFGLDLGTRLRTSLGASRLYGELYVASNYDRGFLHADPLASGGDVREAGAYAAIVQDVTEYAQAGFRLSVYDPNADLLEERASRLVPKVQTITTYSLMVAGVFTDRARLSFQYDFTKDYLARDAVGVPKDAQNNTWTLRLQGEL
jgi:phosphate-selective porin